MKLSIVNAVQLFYLSSPLFFVGTFAECNGGSHLCGRSYDNVTYLITHDSYALSPNIAATQEISIIEQLDDGVRGLKLSPVSSAKDSSIHLCHTFCEVLDAGKATETLDKIASWLKNNTREIVTIMWNNLYNIDAEEIAHIYEASSIMPYLYTPDQSNSWPTLEEMIQSGKRAVNFIDAHPNEEKFPWLMFQFSRIFETPFENTNSNKFNCDVHRIVQDLNPKDLMYVMNHFLYGVIDIASFKIQIPVRNKAKTINGQMLIDHANNCTQVLGKKPNFIEVDFYTVGDALSLVANLNDAEFTGIKSDDKIVALEEDFEFHESSFSPTERIVIDNTESESSALFGRIDGMKNALIFIWACIVLLVV